MRIPLGSPVGRCLLLLTLAALLPLSGCGSSATITGSVSYKGQKLKGGRVIFTAPDGKNSYPADIREDGTYVVEKVPAGEMKISVQTSSLKPPSARQGGGQAYKPPADAAGPPGGVPGYKPPDRSANADKYVEIPMKYEDPTTSGLTYTVTGGKQTKDITLE